LNELFRVKHGDWLTAPKMSLSKAKKIKSLMLEIALWLDMELSTAGLAYSYFERLVLRNVVSKYNRKAAAGAALLLAFKYNEPLEINSNQIIGSRSAKVRRKHLRVESLIDQIELKLHVKRSELLRTELGALVHLRFDLSITPINALHLFEAMLAASPYDPYDGDGLPKEYDELLKRMEGRDPPLPLPPPPQQQQHHHHHYHQYNSNLFGHEKHLPTNSPEYNEQERNAGLLSDKKYEDVKHVSGTTSSENHHHFLENTSVPMTI